MKDFKYYLDQSKPKYKYRVKLAVDDVGDEELDKLEGCLERYSIEYASPFKRTPIQANPLDFANITNMPVFISDIEMAYPSTDQHLRLLISSALGLSEQNVVIYTENDPRQHETDLFLAKQEEKDYIPRVGKDDYEGEEGDGERNDYNLQKMSLLGELETELSKGGAKAEADDVLPADYHDFDRQKEENSVGLFGRLKPKVNYGR